jgi:tetratricopeptide (TPR) repeat protein
LEASDAVTRLATLRPPCEVRRPLRRAARLRRLAAVCLFWLGLGASCGGDVESRMAEVRALQDVGQFAASVEELREILTLTPNLPEANWRLGLALVQMGEPSRAVWPLQKASESSEYEIRAGLLLASTYLQTKNFDEAIRAASRVLEEDAERQAALRIRANANLAARRSEEALRDTSRLVELYPNDYGVRALHATTLADSGHTEEAEEEHALLKKMGAESDDPAFRNRSCLAPATFAWEFLRDLEKARALYEDCASQNPTESVPLTHMMGFFDGIGEPERATALIRSAVETAPESLELRHSLAMRLRNTGDAQGAEQVLLDAVQSFGSARAWSLLANFYRLEDRPEQALEASEKAAELVGGGGDRVRFTLADILIDLGQLDRAEEVASSIELPAYAQPIRGRILLMRGDPEGALKAFEKGIRAWPDNARARYLAGIAARDSGDFDRAISELREAVRANNAETNAALELARIHHQRGQYQQALWFARQALFGRGGLDQPEAYVIAARAATRLDKPERARSSIETLREFGHLSIATRELAILERERSGLEQALEVIEASGLDPADPANAEVLQQLAEILSTLGRGDEALLNIDAALARNPDAAALYELRGLVLLRAGRWDEARAAFERALDLDPSAARSAAGLASIAAEDGEPARAIELFDRAYALDPLGGGDYAYSAAQLVLAAGDVDAGEARLREITQRNPDVIGARNDLAWILSEKGEDLELALALAKDAYQRKPSPEILDTLGWVHFKRGENQQAVALLEKAAAKRPDSPSIRYRLGAALSKAGDEQRARQMLQEALAAGSFPEADEAGRELARLDRR